MQLSTEIVIFLFLLLKLRGKNSNYKENEYKKIGALLKLHNLAKFMCNTCRTVLHVKKHYIAKQKLSIVGDKEEAEKQISARESIVLAERQNVLDTLPLVRADSRLGWEPSMEYTTDEAGLTWKLRQLDYELNVKIPTYRKANGLQA